MARLTKPGQQRNITQRIIRSVCAQLGVRPTELVGPCRKRPLVQARRIVAYVAHSYTPLSLESVGHAMHRDHSTVISLIRRLQEQREIYPAYDAEVGQIVKKTTKNLHLRRANGNHDRTGRPESSVSDGRDRVSDRHDQAHQ